MNQNNLYSLSSLFSDNLFRVPDYQRGYAWRKAQLDDFWEDLNTVTYDSNHYAGMLTFEKVDRNDYNSWSDDTWIIENRGYKPFYVVDGQQRLTTSIILIQAIIETAIKLEVNILNEASLEYIRSKYIVETKPSKISETYIFSYQTSNQGCEFLEQNILSSNAKDDNEIIRTVYTQNLLEAKKYFLEKMENYNVKDLEIVLKKLTQNFKFTTYVVTTDFDVCLTFETMNNRGKPLSHLELLKNRLIYLTALLIDEQDDRKIVRDKINDCWKDIYSYLGQQRDSLSDDLFLYNHYTLYYGFKRDLKNKQNVRYGLVYHEIDNPFNDDILDITFSRKRVIADSDRISIIEIQDYIANMKKNVKVWSYILNPSKSIYSSEVKRLLEQLLRLNTNNDEYILVFSVMCQNYPEEEIINFLTKFEKYIFLDMLAYSMDYRDLKSFKELAIELFESKISLEFVTTEIKKYINVITSSKDLKTALGYRFTKSGYYGWRPIYHVLYEYELYLHNRSKNLTSKVDWNLHNINKKDFESIEHIMPQTLKDSYWKNNFNGFSISERNAFKNSLGNLVCVSRAKNSKLSCKSFPIKKSLKDENFGYIYGSYSEIELCEYEDWSSQEILDRGLKLLNFIEKRWDINLGSREDKIKILGLSFMHNK